MLNEKNERELAYAVKIDEIRPIEGYDRVEHARVNGWWVIVLKNQFKVGDYAIYIEVDSKVPSDNPAFQFLAKRDYKVKTIKMCKVLSQGLLMSFNDFPDLFEKDGDIWFFKDNDGAIAVNTFLTKTLGITYSIVDDNNRKGKGPDKYAKMAARHQKLFKNNKLVKWLYKRLWGKKLLFLFLGRKQDKRGWPVWVVKTDEERCQNLPQLFPGDTTKWIVTEKIDGSSTTFTMKRKGKKKFDFYVCSRNVCFDTPEKNDRCFYDTNIYLEMAEKYKMKDVLEQILKSNKDLEYVTIQAETYGEGVQKRDYSLKGHNMMIFNLIFGRKNGTVKRFNPIDMVEYLKYYRLPCVPVLDTITLPATCEEMLTYADGESDLDGGMREGVVLRTEDGVNSFKAVSNEYLLKYHG